MRRLALVAVISLAAVGGAQDPVKKDLAALQGTWVMVALEVDGKLVPEDKIKDTFLVIKDSKYTTKVKGKSHETTFTLDPSKSPKAIDMMFAEGDKNRVLRGIYLIDGDTLKLCRGLRPEQERPTEFGTWPNTNLFLVTWKRQK